MITPQFVEKPKIEIISIGRGGVYVAPAADFFVGRFICQRKNRFLADFAPGNRLRF